MRNIILTKNMDWSGILRCYTSLSVVTILHGSKKDYNTMVDWYYNMQHTDDKYFKLTASIETVVQ